MTRLRTSRTQAAERSIAVFVLLTVAALLYTRCDVVRVRAQETSASSITVMHTPVTRENGGSNPSLRAGSRSFVAGVVDPKTNRSTGSANADEQRRDGGERPALFLGQRDPARLAMACYCEATGSEPDCAAIDSVIQRRAARAGWTYDHELHAYTSVDRCTRVPTDKEWTRALDIARRVISGEIRNSCPGADQFGGLAISTDAHNARKMVHAGKWRLITCSAYVHNSYFHEVGRR